VSAYISITDIGSYAGVIGCLVASINDCKVQMIPGRSNFVLHDEALLTGLSAGSLSSRLVTHLARLTARAS
jgi:hypothetical protein